MGKTVIILVDCDGVLCDFVSGFLEELNKMGHQFTPDDIDCWDIPSALNIDRRLFYDIAEKEGFCEGLKPYPGAEEEIVSLRNFGKVIVATAPIWSSRTWSYERALWLQRHFGFKTDEIIYASEKRRIQGDILIEDKETALLRWLNADVSRQGFLWARPWNEEFYINLRSIPVNMKVINSWAQVTKWLAGKASVGGKDANQ